MKLNELNLFAGGGGGILGALLLGWRTIGAVDTDEYACKTLNQRIKDGALDPFPVFNMDIAEFNERVAPRYRGVADIVTAGFPCQPFSVAGKQRGEDDARNKWPETLQSLRIVRPLLGLLENVPAITSHEYFRTIMRDLAESGYECRWRVLSAKEVGAHHLRKRLWIAIADADRGGFEAIQRPLVDAQRSKDNTEHEGSAGCCEFQGTTIAAGGKGLRQAKDEAHSNDAGGSGEAVADTEGLRLEEREGIGGDSEQEFEAPLREGLTVADTGGYWDAEPGLGRVANGVANRVDRLRAIGNGQVPLVVRVAWNFFTGGSA